MTFVWADGELNREQVEAITEPGNVYLTACPGSGKTRALTYKAALELSRLESKKRRVVAITYTNRAADEIHERIDALGVSTEQLWIGTIHSFCLDWILRPYSVYHPALRMGFHVVDSHETERRLLDHCQRSQWNLRPWHCEYHFTTRGCQLSHINVALRPAVMEVLEAYWADLRDHHQIDFELILRYAFELISENPVIPSLLSQIFSFVLVDECQDTREVQYGIVAAIVQAGGGRTNAFIVGDANQAIFGSLGGFAMPREDLAASCGAAFVSKSLAENYRSSESIVSYFSNYHVAPTEIRAVGENRLYPSLISYDTTTASRELEDEIARLLRHNIENIGVRPQEICIVAPQWIPLADITRKLVASLPEYDFDGPGIAPFARNIDNFFYKLARLALSEPSPHTFTRRMRWAGDIITELGNAGIPTHKLSRRGILRLCNEMNINEPDGLNYLALFFDEVLLGLGVSLDDHPFLRTHHETFFNDSRQRIDRLENEGLMGISTLAHFRRVFAGRSGITVATIHNIKGAEFDVVIAFGLLQGMVPNFGDMTVSSAKKLLYVICSRARKNLHLISEVGRMSRDGPYEPTEVLLECEYVYDEVP